MKIKTQVGIVQFCLSSNQFKNQKTEPVLVRFNVDPREKLNKTILLTTTMENQQLNFQFFGPQA